MSEHHIVTPKTYATVLGGLLVLMALTVLAAEVDIGVWQNLVVALAIACGKMSLILLFFMHVKYSSNLTRVFAMVGFIWLVIFFILLFADYVARTLGETPFSVSPYGV